MTNPRILASIALVTAAALTAIPAQAGQHRGGGQSGGGSRGATASRGGGQSGGGSRGAAVSRGGGSRGGATAGGRAQTRSNPVYRGGGGVQARSYGGYRGGGVQTRSYGAYRGGGVVVRGGVGTRYGGSRIIVGRSSFYRPYYSRPYYSFRPRLSLGFGLWVGYPVAYPYYYDPYYSYPYSYGYPYAADPHEYGYAAPSYGYPAQPYSSPRQSTAYPRPDYPSAPYPQAGQGYPPQPGPSVEAERGGQSSARGGVSFEITPESAEVFVDGTYVGAAGTFGPSSQPLGLSSGRHRIEIRADGYLTMTFDADVRSGQVLPYQGTLQRD